MTDGAFITSAQQKQKHCTKSNNVRLNRYSLQGGRCVYLNPLQLQKHINTVANLKLWSTATKV